MLLSLVPLAGTQAELAEAEVAVGDDVDSTRTLQFNHQSRQGGDRTPRRRGPETLPSGGQGIEESPASHGPGLPLGSPYP